MSTLGSRSENEHSDEGLGSKPSGDKSQPNFTPSAIVRMLKRLAPKKATTPACSTRKFSSSRWTAVCISLTVSAAIWISTLLYFYRMYPARPLLGWDSISYVGLVSEESRMGPLAFAKLSSSPELYVNILSLLSMLLGNPFLAEEILPPALAFILVIVYTFVGSRSRLTTPALIIVPLATVLSFAFLRTASDLNESLLAILLAWVFLWHKSKRSLLLEWNSDSIISLVLATLVASTELEVFAVLMLALIVYSVANRNWRLAIQVAIVSAAVVGLFSLGFPRLSSNFPGLPNIPSITLEQAVIVSFGSIPLAIIGLLGIGNVFSKGVLRLGAPTRMSMLIFSWTVTSIAIAVLLELGMYSFPPDRALLLVPAPLLLGEGSDWILKRHHGAKATLNLKKTTVATSTDKALGEFVSGNPEAPPNYRPLKSHQCYFRHYPKYRKAEILMSILLIVAIVANSYVSATQNIPRYYQPYVTTQEYETLMQAGKLVSQMGWSSVLVPTLGLRQMYFWSLYEYYLRTEIQHPIVVYGDLRTVLSGLNPAYDNYTSYASTQASASQQSYQGAENELESLGQNISSLPILFISPLIYAGELPYGVNISRYSRGDGIYLIPSGALNISWYSPIVFNCMTPETSVGTYGGTMNGSLAPCTIDAFSLSVGAYAQVSFSFRTPRPSEINVSVRYYAYPPFYNSSLPPYAPINLSMDGVTVASFSYSQSTSGTFVVALASLGIVKGGNHTLSIYTGEPSRIINMVLDTVTVRIRPLQ